MTAPDPYGRIIFHGKLLDNATSAALRLAEERLGYELTIVQGIGGAAASAGTHLEGRAVDLTAFEHGRKVKVLRDLGFAAWYREAIPGLWGEHVHGVLIFESRTNQRGLAPSGFRQISSYDAGRDGLADFATDPNLYRPDPKAVFTLAEYRATFAKPKPKRTQVEKGRSRLDEAIHALGWAAALLEDANEGREIVHKKAKEIRIARRKLEEVRGDLPRK